MSWNERPQKVDNFFHPFIHYTQKSLSADQKRTEGKKAAGSDGSDDDDRPKKKSGKVNGKSKKH